jgi:hypothetical protein
MRGLNLPVGVGPNGGASMVDGDDNDRKIISIALGSSENDNAFQQDITLGEELIFNTDDPAMRVKVLRKLETIFDKFRTKKRFLLKKETISWSSSDGETTLEFKYVNLESDEEKLFRRAFTSAG